MTQADLLDRYIADLQRDPTTPPPPDLDPVVVRALRALIADAAEIPPVGARDRVWRKALAHAKTETDTPVATRDNDPRPGSWFIHTNGKNKPKKKENDPMQTTLTRPTILPRVPTRAVEARFVRLAIAVIAIALSAAILLPGLLPDTSPSGPAAIYLPAAANQAIFERYISEAWNAGNTNVLNDILTADHVCHESGMTDIAGIDGMTALITNYRTAFPNWQFTIEALTATDDAIWARLTGTGTHDGRFTLPDNVVIQATGSVVTVKVMLNARFTDGKITEQWMQSDALGMLLQTETIPTPQEAIADTQQAITEAQNIEVARDLIEAFNNPGTSFGSAEYYYDDALWGQATLEPTSITIPGRNRWVEEELWPAFPDLQITIDRITAEGDLIILETTAGGRFEKSFDWALYLANVPATGQDESWSWVWVLHFEDGKIAAEHWYMDWHSLYEN